MFFDVDFWGFFLEKYTLLYKYYLPVFFPCEIVYLVEFDVFFFFLALFLREYKSGFLFGVVQIYFVVFKNLLYTGMVLKFIS